MRSSARTTADPMKERRAEVGCKCGWFDEIMGGQACKPGCPTYVPPAPTEISGSVTVNNRTLKDEKPNTASYSSYVLSVDQPPVKLMGKDAHRVRALVWTDKIIYIGKRDNVTALLDTAFLQGPLELENQDELWARTPTTTELPGAEAANVTVIQERWSEA